MQSERFDLNKEEICKWLTNTAIFFAPALLLFLLAIKAGSTPQQAFLVVQGWMVNTAIDLVRKFVEGKKTS